MIFKLLVVFNFNFNISLICMCVYYLTASRRFKYTISGADNGIYQKHLSNYHTSTKFGMCMHYSLLFQNTTLAMQLFKMAAINLTKRCNRATYTIWISKYLY